MRACEREPFSPLVRPFAPLKGDRCPGMSAAVYGDDMQQQQCCNRSALSQDVRLFLSDGIFTFKLRGKSEGEDNAIL